MVCHAPAAARSAAFAAAVCRVARAWRSALVLVAATLMLAWPAAHAADAVAADELGPTIVHLLDYVGVDYGATVKDGKVVDEPEYKEQLEFVNQASGLIAKLPERAARAGLLDQASRLLALVQARVPGEQVSAAAERLRWDLIGAYQIAVAPKRAPPLAGAARVFEAQCSSCHGAQGRGDGPAAKGLDPAPANFHDAERMRARSVYGLYNTITLGVAGTSMQGYRTLSDDERWALAFYVASLRHGADVLKAGEAAWQQGGQKAVFPGLRELVTQAPADVQARHGAAAEQVQAWLVAHPDAVGGASASPLQFARTQIDEAARRYAQGQRDAARQLAIAAYLEGFELVENSLDTVAPELRVEVEREMMALRNDIGQGRSVDTVNAQVARIDGLLAQAQDKLSGEGLSPATAFFGSLLILLREGLEAILVLAAIIAFVRKTGRRDAMRWIHVGWIVAVVLGAATWFVAEKLIAISGASRELTEGVTALFAAAMLLYVGYWLHSKSYAQAWSHFIQSQVSTALGRGTLWALASVSFLAVYRELFEIVLFYQALWVQAGASGQHAVLIGIVVAAALLALLTWLILKFSVRLPLGPFFAATAGLLALLAVVFAGHGVAALQEAGVLDASPVRFVTIAPLGVHATLQGVLVQAAALALVVLGVWFTRRNARRG